MYGLVMIRRKDYGRRRALGATRALIIALIVVRTATSLVGALAGSVAALIVLLVGRDPAPAIDFVVAVGLLAIASGVLGSLPPAIAASHRDPLTELRVPDRWR